MIKAKLVAGCLFSDIHLFDEAKTKLEKEFGPADYASRILDFDHTDYYKKEFGENLKRAFLTFGRLFPLEAMYKAKLITNEIERSLSRYGRRVVNIDPGYLDLSKVVLLSTKDYAHRIYLGKGIFAEVTLYYKDESYNPWPWTYPDYKTKDYIEIFNSMRQRYKNIEKDAGQRCW